MTCSSGRLEATFPVPTLRVCHGVGVLVKNACFAERDPSVSLNNTRPFLFPMHICTPLLQSRLLHKSLNFFLSTGTGSGSGVPNVRMMTGPPCQTNNNNKCMYKYILNVEFYTIFMFMLFAHMHGQCFQIWNVQVQTPS